jgi:hypothetical protein
LGLLQAAGRIRRVPINGRLDQQRYAYTVWGLPPGGLDDDGARRLLLERYLRWTGGATFKQTQWFTAFTVAHSKAALAAIEAVEVPTASGDVLWMLPADVERLAGFEEPGDEQIQLLAGTDSLVLHRRNSADMFADEDKGKKVLDTTLALQADLPDIRSWTAGGLLACGSTIRQGADSGVDVQDQPTMAVTGSIGEVETWIREELGDFRSFSLDSPASRQLRIDALDEAAGR